MVQGLRRLFLLIPLLTISIYLFANVVINEVLYDAVGVDTGYEWIELYNNGTQSINLEGAQIQKAGSSFSTVFTFPYFILRPGRYVVVGEQNVPQAMFITSLAFQNGGGATDGIRYVSPDLLYTDTMLYDSPNINQLMDDNGDIGSSFAKLASPGSSLARIMDGFDTNICAQDFVAEANPTPGNANNAYCDFGIEDVELTVDEDSILLSVTIKNYGIITPLSGLELQVLADGTLLKQLEIDPVPAGDTSEIFISIFRGEVASSSILINLSYSHDPIQDNNSFYINLDPVHAPKPLLSEIMYNPETGKQEWIELYLETGYSGRNQYEIRDLAGNRFFFELAPSANGFLVLCNSADALLLQYPQCLGSSVVEVSGWAILNNDVERLYLLQNDVVIDSVHYVGNSSFKGISLERVSYSGQLWRHSTDPSGATPGRVNSANNTDPPIFGGSFYIENTPFSPKSGEKLRLYYQDFDPVTKLSLTIFDLRGRKIRTLADNVSINDEGCIEWDGKMTNSKLAPRGLYILLWESRSSGSRIYSKSFTCVIRE